MWIWRDAYASILATQGKVHPKSFNLNGQAETAPGHPIIDWNPPPPSSNSHGLLYLITTVLLEYNKDDAYRHSVSHRVV